MVYILLILNGVSLILNKIIVKNLIEQGKLSINLNVKDIDSLFEGMKLVDE